MILGYKFSKENLVRIFRMEKIYRTGSADCGLVSSTAEKRSWAQKYLRHEVYLGKTLQAENK